MDRSWGGLFGLIATGLLAVSDSSVLAVDLAPSVESARAAGHAELPVVVTFSAPWCGWCRKMSATTFPDPQLDAISDQFLWVKLDPDDAPQLAAKLRVRGLPHTVVLDARDRLIGTQSGYMTAGGLVQFLKETLTDPQPIELPPTTLLEQLEDFSSVEQPREVVRKAVEELSQREPPQRRELVKRLREAGPTVFPYLSELLRDERLSTRAAAAAVLRQVTGADLPFDPFATDAVRDQQSAAWIGQYPAPVEPPADLP